MQGQKVRNANGAKRFASLLLHLDTPRIPSLASVVEAALPGLGYAAVPVPVRVRHEVRRRVSWR